MIVTGAFFAQNLAQVDGLLHVWGGVWDVFHGEIGQEYSLPMALLVQHEAGESRDQEIVIRAFSPDGTLIGETTGAIRTPEPVINSYTMVVFRATFQVHGRHAFVVETPSGASYAASSIDFQPPRATPAAS